MKLKNWLLILSAAGVIGLTACSTVKISDYPQRQFSVPAQVSAADVQKQIKQAIAQQARAGWVVEQTDSNRVVAGINRRSHYLQVTYLVSGQQVSSQITGSRNLEQKGNKIHKNAMAWKMRLDNAVFSQLTTFLN
ncbi:hypothetical protein BS636_02510 [Acinetobacter sp. LoGeW2-3]|uniref:hypothetical protein n=1 Tax=Acinetobacter sp. LoGeW2-3 TaxID=1808001 RepID=UPI000C05BCB1|nr:hypothetical protein [Acinetobacter sp. LoGeW2-3]ATO18613.1 hypothetical protein BS636_02510 [Acinetobacter sp. LoGeW2-3]